MCVILAGIRIHEHVSKIFNFKWFIDVDRPKLNFIDVQNLFRFASHSL